MQAKFEAMREQVNKMRAIKQQLKEGAVTQESVTVHQSVDEMIKHIGHNTDVDK